MGRGWRTAIIESRCKLSLNDERLLISLEDEEKAIPLQQLKSLIITSQQCTVTTAILTKMADEEISVLFCDDKYLPVAEITPFSQNVFRAGSIMDQALWSQENKDIIWTEIIRQKIKNQMMVLVANDISVPKEMEACFDSVLVGDADGREAEAAQLYFKRLFGMVFRRHAPDNINAALNYGYSILLSNFSRTIRAHGYMTELGIHHINRTNPYNLACDLMEPFRPIVDNIVYLHGDCELSREYKHELIRISEYEVRFKGKTWILSDCIEQYVLDFVKEIKQPDKGLGEVTIV